MRYLSLFLALFLVGCAGARTSATYHANADGTVSAGVRSASDAQPGVVGPQEIAGLALPFGPFTAKAALVWDGQPWFWTPPTPAPAAMASYATHGCAPQVQTYEVDECYTEMVPVQRTRKVQRQAVMVPVPQAVQPRAVCPAPPPAPVSQVFSHVEPAVVASAAP